MSGGMIFGIFVVGMFPALIAVAIVVKLREVRKAQRWPSTQGKVVVSQVGTIKKEPGDIGYNFGDSNVKNYPQVEYTYVVDGKAFRASQIEIGETKELGEVEEKLARYPVGTVVDVYYNPEKPTEACLERDLPSFFLKGIGCLAGVFIGGPILVYLAYAYAEGWLHHHLANPGKSSMVAVIGIMGCFTVWFGLALRKMVSQAKGWPTVSGTIVESDVETFWENSDVDPPHQPTRHYQPAIRYQYEVDGKTYHGDRITIGTRMSSNILQSAKRRAAQYPVGKKVEVFYNPEKPAEAVLFPGSSTHVLPWLMAAILFGLAWAIGSGRFGSG